MLAVGLAALAIAFAVGGTHPERRLEGSNSVGVGQFVVSLKPGQVVCQREAELPAGVGGLVMTIGTYGKPGPLLRTSVESPGAGRAAPAGELAAGWLEGPIEVPLGAVVRRRVPSARICVANRGGDRLVIAGTRVGRRAGATVAGRRTDGRIGMQYVRGGRQSSWDLAGRIASRMTMGTGLWGGLAPWAAAALVLLAAGAAVRALLAGVSRS